MSFLWIFLNYNFFLCCAFPWNLMLRNFFTLLILNLIHWMLSFKRYRIIYLIYLFILFLYLIYLVYKALYFHHYPIFFIYFAFDMLELLFICCIIVILLLNIFYYILLIGLLYFFIYILYFLRIINYTLISCFWTNFINRLFFIFLKWF